VFSGQKGQIGLSVDKRGQVKYNQHLLPYSTVTKTERCDARTDRPALMMMTLASVSWGRL